LGFKDGKIDKLIGFYTKKIEELNALKTDMTDKLFGLWTAKEAKSGAYDETSSYDSAKYVFLPLAYAKNKPSKSLLKTIAPSSSTVILHDVPYTIPDVSYGVPHQTYGVPAVAHAIPKSTYGVPLQEAYGSVTESPAPATGYGAHTSSGVHSTPALVKKVEHS
jgi:hypothetical protein